MSRVDDDRDAARIAERLALAKRAEEAKGTDKSAAASTFSKLVQAQKSAAQQATQQKLESQAEDTGTSAHDAIASLLGQSEAQRDEGAHQSKSHTQSRLGARSFEERVKQGASSEGAAAARVKDASDQGQAQQSSGRAADQGTSSSRSQGRGQDAQVSNARLEDRKEGSDASKSASAGGAKAEKGALKTDADKGGQQGGGKDSKSESSAAPSFRFNPALMAPVNVQKKNETLGSDRLRKAASEIAQKIVERVRVGTNALGKVEFQIDLKNDVLGGMTVKVSSKNGKISAVFSGSDKDVLKLLEEQSELLKTALGSRGLTLESLKIEARA